MTEFAFKANFTDVPAYNTVRAPKGLYKVRYIPGSIVMQDRNTTSGCTRFWLDFEVTEGEYAGASIREFMSLPDSNLSDTEKRSKSNRNAIGFFKAMLISLGIPEDKLNTGKEVNVGEKTLIGKVGHLDYTPKDESMGIDNDKRVWLTLSQYEVRLAAAAAAQDVDTSGVEVERAPARGKVVRRQAATAKNVETEDDIKPAEVATAAEANSPDEFISI